tara:strand:- start:1052 stop:1192 length:141 start_codon:yes stop_codon:yes gene_type:complete
MLVLMGWHISFLLKKLLQPLEVGDNKSWGELTNKEEYGRCIILEKV